MTDQAASDTLLEQHEEAILDFVSHSVPTDVADHIIDAVFEREATARLDDVIADVLLLAVPSIGGTKSYKIWLR